MTIPASITPPKSIPYRLKSKDDRPILSASYDKDEKQPVVVKEPHAKVFDLQDEKDLAHYESIFKGRAEGRILIEIDERNWCEEKAGYVALLRWYNLFIENPNVKDREIVYE